MCSEGAVNEKVMLYFLRAAWAYARKTDYPARIDLVAEALGDAVRATPLATSPLGTFKLVLFTYLLLCSDEAWVGNGESLSAGYIASLDLWWTRDELKGYWYVAPSKDVMTDIQAFISELKRVR